MIFSDIVAPIFIGIIIYFAALTVWYTLLLLVAFPEVLKKYRESKYGNLQVYIDHFKLIPITIVTPAFNEEKRILNMLHSVFNSDYKNVQLIVVNDGSTDNTLNFLIKEFAMYKVPPVIKQTIKTEKIIQCYQSRTYPNLMVIDKEHSPLGCGSDSVNVGLNACKTPIMMTLDADTLVEPEAISRMLLTFMARAHCVAVSGSVYVLNGNKIEDGELLENNLAPNFVGAVQSVEYLRSFLYGRAGWNVLGGAMCYPGAFTLFETDILREIGGFDSKNFSYDAEIIIKIHHWMRKHKYPYNLNHTPNAFAWTEVPGTLKSFWKQRDHWQRGMLRSATLHMAMFLNPRYGVAGMLSFPCYILFEILGPVVEFVSYVLFILGLIFGSVSWNVFFWFILLAWGYITFLSIAMVYLNVISFDKYRTFLVTLRVIWLVFAEMFWFRQYRATCCFVGSIRYFVNRLLGKSQ